MAILHTSLVFLLHLLLWCNLMGHYTSQTVVETLPGFPGKLPFQLETGYIGVGDSERVQTFYYFFESERDPKRDPLIFFLTGGPGCSGLHSWAYQIGPITFDEINSNDSVTLLTLRPYSWSKVSNLLFIDQPVGSGFSYAKPWDGNIGNDSQASELSYQFLKKWLVAHPEFLENPLYIGGDSYGGLFASVVLQHIYNAGGNEVEGDISFNLKGYILGNPVIDKFGDFNSRVLYSYRMGLLSAGLYESANTNCKGNFITPDLTNSLCRKDMQRLDECLGKICLPHILERCCDAWADTKNLFTLLRVPSSAPLLHDGGWCEDHDFQHCYNFANDKAVQEALHVRKGTITEWFRCNRTMSYGVGLERTIAYDFNVKSTIATHKNLSSQTSLRALVYSGDHDLIIPHTGTEEWIRALNLTVERGWRPWIVDNEVAGFTERYSRRDYELTYATVKGGGHLPSEQKPKECFIMFSKWLAEDPL